jgi:enolase
MIIELDGTEGKYNLGANAIVGVSMAVCKAGACAKRLPLYEHIAELSNNEISTPFSCFNIINGGAHSDNGLDFQEFMIVPQSNSFRENLRMGSEIYYQLKKVLKDNCPNVPLSSGDEGRFAP